MSRHLIDLTGRTFGQVRVLRLLPPRPGAKHRSWEAQCRCGKRWPVEGRLLRTGGVKRCLECKNAYIAAYMRKYASVKLPDGRTIAQIALVTGVRLDTVYHRWIRGWPLHALGDPPLARGEKRSPLQRRAM